MMYDKLYQYLILHKELPVPGIGTFLLERKSAEVDFPNKKINPPSYSILMQPGSHLPGRDFFSWLAHALGITDREAIFRFNDFAFEMKKQISEGTVINWNAVGIINNGLGADIKFTPLESAVVVEKSIIAVKVIREKSEHMVRVGEDEKTSDEMTEMLSHKEKKKEFWWAYALAVALLATMFMGWYFSEHGVDISATASGQKLIPMEPGATYQTLP